MARYTAADLERMSPQERERTFDESIIKDLKNLPPHLQRHVDEARAWVEARETSTS